MINVAINGFGRIGRMVARSIFLREGIQLVAINDLTEPSVLAHLLQYDSVFKTWNIEVKSTKDALIIDGKKIPVFTQTDPSKLPWVSLQIDVVIESTGRFTKKDEASLHLLAGAKNVVISAPSSDTPTYLMGVNHFERKKTEHVINNASCTTNSISPIVSILEESFGVKKAMLTTVHSVTMEQNLVDGLPPKLHPDLRRSRSALVNMVPTSTGAAKAVCEVIPSLKGKFDGIAIRVPTIDVSLTDFTAVLNRKTTQEELVELFTKASKLKRWKGILGVTDLPLVSMDFVRSDFGCVVDLTMTRVVDGDLVKILAWYDNEWGYTQRLIDLAQFISH